MHPAFTDPCLGVVRASLSFSCRCAGLIWIIRCSRCSLARFAPPVQHHRKTVKHLPHHCDVKSWMLSDLSQPTPSQAKAERETSSYTKQRWRAETHPTCTLSWISARAFAPNLGQFFAAFPGDRKMQRKQKLQIGIGPPSTLRPIPSTNFDPSHISSTS